MSVDDWIMAALLAQSVLYLVTLVAALRGSPFQKRARRALILYLSVSCSWMLAQLLWRFDWLDGIRAEAYPLEQLPTYGILVLALLFLHLTQAFLRLQATSRRWWRLAALWLIGLVLFDSNLLRLADKWWTYGDWYIDRAGVGLGLLSLGAGIFMARAGWLTLRSFWQTRQPLHRNRLRYWLPVVGLTLVGGGVFLAEAKVVGNGLTWVGALVATYAVVTHDLPDVRRIRRRLFGYALVTLLTIAIYTASFALIQRAFSDAPGYSPLLAGAAAALILVVLFQPLLRRIQRPLDRLLFGASYDPQHILRQYSTSISNIVDLALLANVMLRQISEAMGSRYGRLFLVDSQKGPDGEGYYQLRDVGGMGGPKGGSGLMPDESPLIDHLHGDKKPLTQYDIDLLPYFRERCAAECEWLSGMEMDVYVPIHAQWEWMGLLALGPKMSGDRYFDDDLALLSTLADQTAVALQNARLVEDLIQANNEIGQNYAALNRANRQLQELDKLKSAFIGTISHELRTPFANLLLSLELLERHGQEHMTAEMYQQVEQLAEGIKSAKTMVDNLVTFSTFLSKRGQLRPARLDFGQVVRESLEPLQSLAESKSLTLRVSLPENLPAVRADQGRLSDAIYHLVQNAIKFTPAEGQVWVRCRPADGQVRFEVQDTGVGVPADKLPKLWENFEQMADPLRRGMEGLGLGLALVKYVINAHGGEVWAESQEGIGSTFGFHLPALSPEPEPEGAPSSQAPSPAIERASDLLPLYLLHDFGGQGPLVHLAHANGFPPATYTPLAEALIEPPLLGLGSHPEAGERLGPGYQVVAMPARPLWPDSQPDEAPTWHTLANDMIQALEGLEPPDKVIGVGHSLGGVCTLFAAVRRPDLFRAVVLIDPVILPSRLLRLVRLLRWLGLERRLSLVRGALKRRQTWPDRQACFEHYQEKPLFANWSDESLWAYVEAGTQARVDGGVELVYPPEWEAHVFATTPTDVWDYVPQLEVPALFVRGEDTDTFRPESRRRVQELLPRARFRLILEAGHLVPMERPAEVAAAIHEFLAGLADRPRPV